MDNQNNFFDKKTIYAAVVVFGVLMLWQNYLNKKYRSNSEETKTVNVEAAVANKPMEEKVNEDSSKAEAAAAVSQKTAEEIIVFENDKTKIEISSHGMGFKNIVLKKHLDRDGNQVIMNKDASIGLFALGSLDMGKPIDFKVDKISDNEFRGIAEISGLKITRSISYDPVTDSFKNKVNLENVNEQFKGLTLTMAEKSIGQVSRSVFSPTFESQEVLTLHNDKEERIKSSTLSEKYDNSFSNVRLVGISSHYFTSSLVDKSDVAPDVSIKAGKGVDEVNAVLIYKPAQNSKNNLQLEWITYSGGKSLATLESIDKDFKHVLDFGFFSSIGIVLLKLMQWFHSMIPNWGLAIILLTMLVRLIVLPLNITTFRSTKKMQAIQPIISALRERYKDDPQTLNKEMMGVWKEHKVNPFGGCLPMLLQLPIFFALYQVLGQSIELYHAPFFGWIHDLSQKDPWYILPVLMAVAMFLQQKMTPTTMDPTQAKIMQFMPLIFAVMMVNLPAGLTLYIFVNTLSGVLLQQIFMRDRSKTVKAVKA